MTKYIMRLDDASEYMDVDKWNHMKKLLDKYNVKPIFGIIPNNKDESLVNIYEKDENFWCKMLDWISNGWVPALHGYEHRYVTQSGGCNPVNARSEFAGLSLEEQSEKISRGYEILKKKGIVPEIFFAPSHTFDRNTLLALKKMTLIRVISDTVANDIYKKDDFWFIPQQSGVVRKLPFKVVTFCYHPNVMDGRAFEALEDFLKDNKDKFVVYDRKLLKERRLNVVDKLLRWLYFAKRR